MMASPEYHAAWRRAHRDVENARKRRLRACPGWRAAHEPDRRDQRRAELARVEIPAGYVGHEAFARAEDLVGRRPSFDREVWEDAMGAVVVALVEGTDPVAALRAERADRRRWLANTLPLLGDWAA